MSEPDFPLARLLGFEQAETAPGTGVVTFQAEPRHNNTLGTLHGGVLCDIADAAMGHAFRASLAPGESFTTVELKINFLRPVRLDRLRASARMLKQGRTLGYLECDITNQRGELVARASCTCMRLGAPPPVAVRPDGC